MKIKNGGANYLLSDSFSKYLASVYFTSEVETVAKN